MKNSLLLCFIIAFLGLLITTSAQNPKMGKVIVYITNIKNNNGNIRATIFDSKNKKYYPNAYEKSTKQAIAGIKNQKAKIVFDNLDYGEYAVAVHHDENKDNQINTNFLGIPKESYGASNNATKFAGAPKFDDAKVQLNSDSLVLNIKMK